MARDKLKFLAMANNFEVYDDNGTFTVLHKNDNLKALIEENGDISYYVTGVYNSGSDIEEICMPHLMELKSFCEHMIKED